MAKEEKLDIEDIKDPEELDLDEAISEEDLKENKTEEKEEIEAVEEKNTEPEKDVLEEAQEERVMSEGIKAEPKSKKIKKPVNWKVIAIVFITILATTALVLGGVYYFSKKKAANTPAPAETAQTNNNVEINVTPPAQAEKSVYVNAIGGLNLREEPSTSAKILALIPFGTKLNVISTQGTWYKTTYNSQTGWVDSTYTQDKNPLVYQNTEHGYELTFPASWATYKITTKTLEGTPVDYVTLATTDKSWTDTAAGTGYASMFAITIYTKEQWESAKAAEGPKPTYLGEKGNYVFAWSQAQAMPADLSAQYQQIKSVIATFKTI